MESMACLQVILFVFIVEKNIGTVVTSLGYMMGIFGCYDSGYSRHIDCLYSENSPMSINISEVSLYSFLYSFEIGYLHEKGRIPVSLNDDKVVRKICKGLGIPDIHKEN